MRPEYQYHPEFRRCIHFRGIQNVCGAGVDPKTVRDAAKPGIAVWPCLHVPGYREADTVCSKLRVMTREELDAETEKMLAAVDAFEARMKDNKCGHCGEAIRQRKRVGRCEYAEPCGHRLGQVGGDEP